MWLIKAMRAIKLKEDGNGLHGGILVLNHLILLQFCKALQLSYGMPWNCFGSQQLYQAQSIDRHSAIAGSVYSNKILNRVFCFVCPLVLSSVSSYIIFRHKQGINAHFAICRSGLILWTERLLPRRRFLSCLLLHFPLSEGIKALCHWPYFPYRFKEMWCFSVYEQGEADWMRNSFM